MDSLDTRFDKQENAARTGYLIGGFITGALTIEEREELDAWVLQSEANMQLFEDMTDEPMIDRFMKWLATRDTEGKLAATKQRLKFKRRPRVLTWWRYAAAACIVGVIGWVIYNNLNRPGPEPGKVTVTKADIVPGSAMAELHLPAGKIIKLDGVGDTVINSIRIKEGEVIYGVNELDTAMHEIIIPRKGFYKLVLPDGSRVWLNSESSIRYPGTFVKNKREVTVTGETFFKVAKDPLRPFVVAVNDRKVHAIGTEFNINGFDKTVTLTEGIVEVTSERGKKILKPGEQLDSTWNAKEVDTTPVVAWTKNQFKFKKATIDQIMPSLERWYDCRTIYEDNVRYHFNGTIDRTVPVSRVLELLEGTGQVHFTIKENTITVKK